MGIKLVSKNNIGIVTMLLLVVILSHSQIFNFLVDTPLGRALLISLLIFISYTNNILGIVTVLIIIIMFNNSNIGYLEGFTDNSTKLANNKSSVVSSIVSSKVNSKNNSKNNSKVNSNIPLNSSHSPSTSNTLNTTLNTKKSADNTNVTKPVEGFDIIGKERNIQKGKQSNSIPVSDFMRESNSVSPYQGSSFSEEFSLY